MPKTRLAARGSHPAPGRVLSQRFKLGPMLKDGHGVATFKADDLAAGRGVVVKAVSASTVADSVLQRLEHEAGVLSKAESPRLAPLVDFGVDGEIVYLATAHIDGRTLADHLRGASPLEISEALRIARGIVEALRDAHQLGVVHRDVKPANLMLGADGDSAVILIDFGLARSSRLSSSLRELPVGTAHYMSPEQAGLLHASVDQRSDLYSAGAVLFECFAARPPFDGNDVGEVLRQQLTAIPPRLDKLRPELPEALDDLVQKLLRKDPGDRYQSADSVAADLGTIADALGRGESPSIVVGLGDRGRRAITEPEFVARDEELARRQQPVHAARAGAGGLVLVEAESGGGKTKLLEELAGDAEKDGVWILRGQGRDRGAPSPYQLLEGVLEGVLDRARTSASFAERLRTRLATHAEALVDAMPQAAELFEIDAAASLGSEEYGEVRSMRALAALLEAIGEDHRPALLLLDDCQWADELTIKLLRHWAAESRHDGFQAFVLLVGAFRTEEIPDGHPLRKTRALARLALPPLGTQDVERLVESMAGPVPDQAVDVVRRLSEGSPFMAAEVLRGLVETGALVSEEEGWAIRAETLADVQSSRRAAAVLGRRLEQLPPHVLDLLTAGAVLGKQFTVELAAQLADQSPSEAAAGVSEAERRHVVWLDPPARECTFVHDKLREALLDRMDPEQRRQLHLIAGDNIERRHREWAFELAYHFDAAGHSDRALPYAIQAAEAARARHAHEIAVAQYEIAERGAKNADAALRARIAEGLGESEMLRGRYDAAQQAFTRARSLVTDRLGGARLEGKLGELAFKRGDVKTASELIERGLHQLGQPAPRSRGVLVLRLAWEVFVQTFHTLMPRFFVGRRRLTESEAELLAPRLYSRLAHAYWFQRGLLPCGWAHMRNLNLSERYPESPELGMACSEHTPVATMIPWYGRGLEYGERGVRIYSDLGDVWGEGHARAFHGFGLYAASRWEEALEELRAGVRILERTGDQWEVNTALWHIALCLYRMGRLPEAVETAQRVHRAGIELGDKQASGIALGIWAKASGGAVPRDLIEAELKNPSDDVHTRAEVLTADALSHLAAGRPEDAVEALELADELVSDAGLRQEYVAPVRPWLVTARRSLLDATSQLTPRERRRRLRRARRSDRRARRLARSYRNNLPHALREGGRLAAMRGRARRAERLLERSMRIATEQGAPYERATTMLALAELEVALGKPGGAERFADAQAALEELTAGAVQREPEDRPVTLSLADRFSSLLEEGRKIASGLSEAAVFAAVTEAAQALLRGEHAALIDVRQGPPFELLAGGLDHEPSRSVVDRALANEGPVVLTLDAGGAASESIILARVRSVICTPIQVRGDTKACLYVTHAGVAGLFGEDEERVVAFIAALAGAALENAEGFSEVQALSRTLEQRVEERTAELKQSNAEIEVALSVLEATLESTADGILVVNREGRIVQYNQKFVEMWRMPAEVMETGDDDRAIAFVLDQLVEPDRFLAKIRELYDHPEAESSDALRFKDGRIFERYSMPHMTAGQSMGRVWSFRDVTEQKRHERGLKHLADHDNLTGMFNRRRFEEELGKQLRYASRYGREPTGVLLLDLDNFKYVNDVLGHKAGDEVIQSVATVVGRCLRSTDIAARLGGDEFAVIIPEGGMPGARQVADSMLETIREHVTIVGGQRVTLTCSIGIALADQGADADQLLVEADLAMYEAKDAGKDRISTYTPARAKAARAEARFTWVERIRRALDEDLFVLHHQPICDLGSGEISQHELLLRLADGGELVPPGAFLPSAERLGLVQAIDRWVIERAIRLIAEHAAQGHDLRLEVNLSARSIDGDQLTRVIEEELTRTSVDPSSLIFEVTETAAIANMRKAVEFARNLAQLGCQFALDDFGTGFGSFYYLKHLPVSYLKIDGAFIADLPDDPTDQHLVRAIVGLAKNLGTKTIAEFVGDERTMTLLAEYGVDYAQGFHVGKPQPVETGKPLGGT